MTIARAARRGGVAGLGLLVLLGLGAGCGKKDVQPEGRSPRLLRLEQIFRMAQMRKKGNQPPATSLQDFAPSAPSYPLAVQALESGECVFVWSAYAAPPASPAMTVLAYEKEVPSQGGYVVTLDGKVKAMSAEEFRAARPSP
jgi:hypothetical protein